ncbi:MAG: ankyrin repeat domain-containing protein, partial [Parashewanella sp.]
LSFDNEQFAIVEPMTLFFTDNCSLTAELKENLAQEAGATVTSVTREVTALAQLRRGIDTHQPSLIKIAMQSLNPNGYYGKTGETLLQYALKKNSSLAVLNTLMQLKVNPNFYPVGTIPPIFQALAKTENIKETIQLLIASGTSPNAQEPKHLASPLMIAACHARTETFSILLNAGANINHKDRYGNTVLHYAFACGRIDQVHLLLNNKKETCIVCKNNNGRFPPQVIGQDLYTGEPSEFYSQLTLDGLIRESIEKTYWLIAIYIITNNFNEIERVIDAIRGSRPDIPALSLEKFLTLYRTIQLFHTESVEADSEKIRLMICVLKDNDFKAASKLLSYFPSLKNKVLASQSYQTLPEQTVKWFKKQVVSTVV